MITCMSLVTFSGRWNGEYLSVITAGGSGSDRAVAITVDEEDSLYITGYFENEATFGACGQVSSMGAGDIFFGKYIAIFQKV